MDINLLYDKALNRPGASNFDQIVDLARSGDIRLYFTATTDFEDRSGDATKVAVRLMMEGLLFEAPNAGSQLDFMPGGPERVNDFETPTGGI